MVSEISSAEKFRCQLGHFGHIQSSEQHVSGCVRLAGKV